MRDYHKERREREPLVKELYGLGVSAPGIATITEWSKATISNDMGRLGGAEAFPNRPKKKGEVFATVIRLYAAIMTKFGARPMPKAIDATREALAAWLREDLILAMLHGLEFTLDALSVPHYPPKWKAHAHLLGVIMGVTVGNPCNAESWPLTGTKFWWRNILAAIKSGEEVLPQSRRQLGQMIVRRLLSERRAEIMPIWDESVFLLVDEMLGTLVERAHQLICEHFGIGVAKARTLDAIAAEWGVTRERLRQIEAKAISKLRREAHKRGLDVLGAPVGSALQRELARREAEKEAALRTEEAAQFGAPFELATNPHLFRRVDELEFSVRSTNCLRYAGVVLVGELVQKTEVELLRGKNFAKKSLKEIKKALKKLDLDLCMKGNDRLNVLLAEHRRAVLAAAQSGQNSQNP